MNNPKIKTRIYAGEGELLSLEWEGETTKLGIKQRLTKARCNGDRRAFAVIDPYETKYGDMAGYDFESGELSIW